MNAIDSEWHRGFTVKIMYNALHPLIHLWTRYPFHGGWTFPLILYLACGCPAPISWRTRSATQLLCPWIRVSSVEGENGSQKEVVQSSAGDVVGEVCSITKCSLYSL